MYKVEVDLKSGIVLELTRDTEEEAELLVKTLQECMLSGDSYVSHGISINGKEIARIILTEPGHRGSIFLRFWNWLMGIA